MPKCKGFIKDTNGDAIVEAAILFPIMIMIFAALVLLAIYLPTRAALQRATQYAATAIATEISDTWLYFDERTMSYSWKNNKSNLKNVYAVFFSNFDELKDKGENIGANIESRSLSYKAGEFDIGCDVINHIIYKEVVVWATREISILPLDLSFIGFPESITITVTSTAVVQNADEFVRSIDIAVDFVGFIADKFNISNVGESITKFGNQVQKLLGW